MKFSLRTRAVAEFLGTADFLRKPAVTLAHCASNTFAGIRPADLPPFVMAQLLGAVTATFFSRWLVFKPVEILETAGSSAHLTPRY
jgi:glycerol uptake facilitator-like aquaporin